MSGTPDPILPDNPGHRHYPLYRHLLQGVEAAQPARTPEQRANLAAGLADAYLQSLPERDRGLRLDETTIRALSVVSGRPDAPTPSLFVVTGTPGAAAPLISTPLAIVDVAASQTLARYAQQRSVGADGYLTGADIVRSPVARLTASTGPLAGPNSIVMHRTAGNSAFDAMSAFQQRGYGTHFIIDRDGSIRQTASLDRYTNHVGPIKSRCAEEGTCSAQEQATLDEFDRRLNGAPLRDRVNRHERGKDYPDRYPTSLDSIGIEVVANYDKDTGLWQELTPAQRASIDRLVGTLQDEYGINRRDIHEHDRISYKTRGEGDGLVEPNAHDRDPGILQRSGPAR